MFAVRCSLFGVSLQRSPCFSSGAAAPGRRRAQPRAGEVWRGPADPTANLPAGVIARFDVPASRLGIDDYIVVGARFVAHSLLDARASDGILKRSRAINHAGGSPGSQATSLRCVGPLKGLT